MGVCQIRKCELTDGELKKRRKKKKKTGLRQRARGEEGESKGGPAHEGTWKSQADFHFIYGLLVDTSF